jgi:hypothetical protein
MGSLLATLRNQSKTVYLEFGNAYTILNNLPDKITSPVFDSWMAGYGYAYRQNVLFTINYQTIQYFINFFGSRAGNYTYIDAIGM